MSKKPDFETALGELETIVHNMEQGNMPLKEALSSFERGIKLINYCNEELEAFEKKIEILVEENGKKKGVKYEPHNSELQDYTILHSINDIGQIKATALTGTTVAMPYPIECKMVLND